MPQFFLPSTNTIMRVGLYGFVFFLALIAAIGYAINRSPYETLQRAPREQPVAFSHKHHSGELGIDCRYCHTTVEKSSFANIPPTSICMNCHSEMWAASPALEPVRESYRTGKSIEWTRVHDLPMFVYFNHSIHVSKGFGCSACHGRVDQMPLTWQSASLEMEWCLDCHRQPEKFVRPVDQVYNMAWQSPTDQLALGRRLVREYRIQSMTSCDTCHR
jgi:hypothetical protein